VLQVDKAEREAWKVAPLPELIRHIVGKCHLECREDMARLETLVELSALEAGQGNPPLLEIRDMIARFCFMMRAHLAQEERNLFPALLGLQDGELPATRKASLEALRSHLEGDHEAEASMLRGIRTLTGTLAASSVPGSPQGEIHEAMKTLSERLQWHFYMENQILFPRTR
jgi:iron-sulfur cluster repair protein YtfE (RIC family)